MDAAGGRQKWPGKDGVVTAHLDSVIPATPARLTRRSVSRGKGEVNVPVRYSDGSSDYKDLTDHPEAPIRTVDGHRNNILPTAATSLSQPAFGKPRNEVLLNGEVLVKIQYASDLNKFHINEIKSSMADFAPITPDKNKPEVCTPQCIDLENDEIIRRDKQKNGAVMAGKASQVIFSDQCTSAVDNTHCGKLMQETIADAGVDKTASVSFAPVTPGKPKETQSVQLPVNGTKEQEKHCMHRAPKEPAENRSELSSELSSQPQIQKDQNVDFIQTPVQKPRRKKHRPKVIQEGKPTRRKNPRSELTEEGLPRKRRKYVRRKGENIEDKPSTEAAETTQPTENHVNKTVNRSLNFDPEVLTQGYSDCSMGSKSQTEYQNHNAGSHFARTSKTSQGLGEVVNPSVEFASTCCQPTVGNDNPQKNSLTAQNSGRLILKENLMALARKRDQRAGHCLDPLNLQAGVATPENRRKKGLTRGCDSYMNGVQGSNIAWQVGERGLTRGNTELHTSRGSQCKDTLQVNFTPEIFKQKRTTTVRGLDGTNAYISTSPLENRDHINDIQNVYNFTGIQRVSLFGKWQPNEHMLTCNNEELKSTGHPSVTLVEEESWMFTNMCANQSEVQLSPKMSFSIDLTQGSSWTETATESQLLKAPRKRRAKKDNINNANSFPFNYTTLPKPIRKTNVRLYKRLSRASIPDLVDFIVQQFKLLHISLPTGTMAQCLLKDNAMVPYSGGGMVVPFEGTFDFFKRKKARAKVDLDSETNRVWLLLMGKEAADGPQGTDTEKEHWWEEERKIFRGRTDSFIARMHLIQGDRRFSPWKGSVVDSVVGVFLTQNVSDHASSSAFMAIAAKFPASSREDNNHSAPEAYKNVHSNDRANVNIDNCVEQKERKLYQQGLAPHPTVLSDFQHVEINVIANGEDLPGNNSTNNNLFYVDDENGDDNGSRVKCCLSVPNEKIECSHEQKEITKSQCEINVLNENTSSQTSLISSTSSCDSLSETIVKQGPFSDLRYGVACLDSENKWNSLDASTSFTDLLQMAENRLLTETSLNDCAFFSLKKSAGSGVTESNAVQTPNEAPTTSNLNNIRVASHVPASRLPFRPADVRRNFEPCSTISHMYNECDHERGTVDSAIVHENDSVRSSCATGTNETPYTKNCCPSKCLSEVKGRATESACKENPVLRKSTNDISTRIGNGLSLLSEAENIFEKTSCCSNSSIGAESPTSHCNMSEPKKVQFRSAGSHQIRGTYLQEHTIECPECLVLMPDGRLQKSHTGHNLLNTSDTAKVSCCIMPEDGGGKTFPESSKAEVDIEKSNKEKPKRRKHEKKSAAFDWDSLRRQMFGRGARKERSKGTLDSVNWEAVRDADVSEVSSTIRDRGMNNMLAERIKDFLDRLVREHGSIDLEWLRDIPPDKAKDYLLSIRGLGLKSVECVRLLTLHHLAFPVDTNVGRICVRLGWVPLQPLPESLQLHLLEMYPILETIQKYLWPRLCTLDQQTLYELHYQLITFGKVFCTKSKPNCNACPMRAECRHFASAFASARLALPGPEEKGLVSSANPTMSEKISKPTTNIMPLPQLEGNTLAKQDSDPTTGLTSLALHENVSNSKVTAPKQCEPIIEEPASPEPECLEVLERDIEDAFYEDPDEIPTIKLNIERFAQNLQTIIQESSMELQDGDMSKALVALTSQAASIPQPKLKHINRLRTEHQVYELPDSHPLLKGLDKREPDDPCPYLLAIWTPGETAQSTESPETSCNFGDPSKLCDNTSCFACSSVREARAQKVRGTLLIPCRTAMRGSFPLNGTYFQVNEVFADHSSSLCPIDVPREWIWNLPRRTVYFGTSIPSIFKGLTTESIQHCFWRGFVCIRGFDQTTRAPRPLMARLHFPASKMARTKKTNTDQSRP